MSDMKEMSEDILYNLFRSLEIDLMEIAFIDRDEGFLEESHMHNWLDISFVMKGALCYEINKTAHTVNEGEVVVVSPGKLHKETRLQEDFEVLFVCICFKKDGKSVDITENIQIPEVINVTNLKGIYEIFDCILQEVTYRDPGYLLKIKAQVLNLLVSICRNESLVTFSREDAFLFQ